MLPCLLDQCWSFLWEVHQSCPRLDELFSVAYPLVPGLLFPHWSRLFYFFGHICFVGAGCVFYYLG